MNPIEFVTGKPQELSFSTSLSPEECVRRLELGIPYLRKSYFFGVVFRLGNNFRVLFENGINGLIKAPEILLWYQPEVWYNSYISTYHGKLIPDGKGTIIKGHFDVFNFVKKYFLFILGVLLLYILSVATLLMPKTGFTWESSSFILIALFMIIILFVMSYILAKLGKKNRPPVIDFIRNCLEATPIDN